MRSANTLVLVEAVIFVDIKGVLVSQETNLSQTIDQLTAYANHSCPTLLAIFGMAEIAGVRSWCLLFFFLILFFWHKKFLSRHKKAHSARKPESHNFLGLIWQSSFKL